MRGNWADVVAIGLLLGFGAVLARGWPQLGGEATAAAWVQAVGSVIAIFSSVGIVQYKILRDRIAKESAATNRVVAFSAMLNKLKDELSGFERFHRDSLRAPYALIKEWLIDARSIGFEHLSVEWLTTLNMMRGGALQLAECLRQEFDVDRATGDIDFKLKEFSDLKKGIDIFCADFEQQVKLLHNHPSVPHVWQRSGIEQGSHYDPKP